MRRACIAIGFGIALYLAPLAQAETLRVAVSAFAQAESIVFTVDGESEYEDVAGSALEGRALLHAVADAILRPRRGQIAIRSLAAGHRVELTVPATRR